MGLIKPHFSIVMWHTCINKNQWRGSLTCSGNNTELDGTIAWFLFSSHRWHFAHLHGSLSQTCGERETKYHFCIASKPALRIYFHFVSTKLNKHGCHIFCHTKHLISPQCTRLMLGPVLGDTRIKRYLPQKHSALHRETPSPCPISNAIAVSEAFGRKIVIVASSMQGRKKKLL